MTRRGLASILGLASLALLVPPGQSAPAAAGRAVYAREACWQCHVREGDERFPALHGTRRTGVRLGANLPPRSPGWQRAHLFEPRRVSPGSQMPAFAHLFAASPRAARVRALIERYDTRDGGRDQDGIVTRVEYEAAGGGDWEGVTRELDSGNGVVSAADAAPEPSAGLEALIAWLPQGRRPPPRGPAGYAMPADPAAGIARGESLYLRFCAGCHGERANGNGPAAAFFGDHSPRNFLRGEFRYRSTPVPQPPTDADLARTIRHGAGPSMPAWPQLADSQVGDLVEFVKSNHPDYVPRELFVEDGSGRTVLAFVRGSAAEPAEVPDASGAALDGGIFVRKRAGRWWLVDRDREQVIEDNLRVARYRFRLGRAVYGWMADRVPRALALAGAPIPYTRASAGIGARVYAELGCASCHGEQGRGDGPAAARTRGSLGQVLRPTDYTRGAAWLKGGADARSVVRTLLTGLQGTPMPAFEASNFAHLQSAPEALAPWHLAHFVLAQAGVPYPD